MLRVVAATVISEGEFQSCTVLWLNTFLRISNLLSEACPSALWYIALQFSESITRDLADLDHVSAVTYEIQRW